MLELNLPPFGCKIKKKDARLFIWDGIRRKYVALTPEEWVRQHFVNYLVAHRGVPSTLVSLEYGMSYNMLAKRSDILIWNRDRQPLMIVECKASHVPVGGETVFQLGTYNTAFRAPWLAVTNGLAHHYFQKEGEEYRRAEELPDFSTLV